MTVFCDKQIVLSSAGIYQNSRWAVEREMKNNADGVMERSKSVVKSNKSVVKKKINNSSFLRGILDFTISANILQFFLSSF